MKTNFYKGDVVRWRDKILTVFSVKPQIVLEGVDSTKISASKEDCILIRRSNEPEWPIILEVHLSPPEGKHWVYFGSELKHIKLVDNEPYTPPARKNIFKSVDELVEATGTPELIENFKKLKTPITDKLEILQTEAWYKTTSEWDDLGVLQDNWSSALELCREFEIKLNLLSEEYEEVKDNWIDALGREKSAWVNRDMFCSQINILGKDIIGPRINSFKGDCVAPEAVVRETKKLIEKFESENNQLKDSLKRIAAQRENRYESTIGYVCDIADKALNVNYETR